MAEFLPPLPEGDAADAFLAVALDQVSTRLARAA